MQLAMRPGPAKRLDAIINAALWCPYRYTVRSVDSSVSDSESPEKDTRPLRRTYTRRAILRISRTFCSTIRTATRLSSAISRMRPSASDSAESHGGACPSWTRAQAITRRKFDGGSGRACWTAARRSVVCDSWQEQTGDGPVLFAGKRCRGDMGRHGVTLYAATTYDASPPHQTDRSATHFISRSPYAAPAS